MQVLTELKNLTIANTIMNSEPQGSPAYVGLGLS